METRFTFFGKGNDMANFEETRDNFTDIEATIIEADERDDARWWTWPIRWPIVPSWILATP